MGQYGLTVISDRRRLAALGFAIAALADAVSHLLTKGLGYILAFLSSKGLVPALMPASGAVGTASDIIELYFVSLILPYILSGSLPSPAEALRRGGSSRLIRCVAALLILRGASLAIWPNLAAGVLEAVSAVMLLIAFNLWLYGSEGFRPLFLAGSLCLMLSGFAGAPPVINVDLGVFGVALLIPALFIMFHGLISGRGLELIRKFELRLSELLASVALIAGGADSISAAANAARVLGMIGAGGIIGILGGLIAVLVGIVALIHSITRFKPGS